MSKDHIVGTIGDDVLNGGNGKDFIFGDLGNDQLSGGNGNDVLDGGLGDDVFNGGRGVDTLTTGDGLDVIQIHKSGGGFDVVTDFDTASDSIVVDAGISLRHVSVKDWNGDGINDVVLQFSQGGSLVLLGDPDPTPVEIIFL
jgi:Ca2+-binding RTX toxin-like protein